MSSRPVATIGAGTPASDVAFRYRTAGGASEVAVPKEFDAGALLKLDAANMTLPNIKAAFYALIQTPIRQQRAMASLAYAAAGSALRDDPFPFFTRVDAGSWKFRLDPDNIFVRTLSGDCTALERMLPADATEMHRVLASELAQESLLYVACRSGYVDVVSLLLRRGFQVDEQQRIGSTALHAAAYFGHEPVVMRLLACGARTTLKNNFQSTAADEARTDGIKRMIADAEVDTLAKTIAACKDAPGFVKVERVEHRGEVVAHRVLFNPQGKCDRARFLKSDYTCAWHGTKAKHLTSILTNGLRAAGTPASGDDATAPTPAATHGVAARAPAAPAAASSRAAPSSAARAATSSAATTLVEVPSGHIPLGVTVDGVDNWSAAVFVSPSVSYSCHGAYAERILGRTVALGTAAVSSTTTTVASSTRSGAAAAGTPAVGPNAQWCVVLECAVRHGSFTSHASTVVAYVPLRSEPGLPELRVPGGRATTTSSAAPAAPYASEPTDDLDESGAASEGVEILRVAGNNTVPISGAHRSMSSVASRAAASLATDASLPNVVVVAVVFVKLSFVETARSSLTFAEVQRLLQSAR